MKNVLIDPIPLGSRWEIFINPDDLNAHIDEIIKKPALVLKNEKFGAMIGPLENKVYTCLIFQNARLTSAFPFLFDLSFKQKVEIEKIEYTNSGEAYINVFNGTINFKASAVDYSYNSDKYKKQMPLYFSAISYTFSKVYLKTGKVKGLVSPAGFLQDEYTATGNIKNENNNIFNAELLNTDIDFLPVYAKNIYKEKPEINTVGAGDIWLTCFSSDFAKKLKSNL